MRQGYVPSNFLFDAAALRRIYSIGRELTDLGRAHADAISQPVSQ